MAHYGKNFRENEIVGETLKDLTNEELDEDLGKSELGQRFSFLLSHLKEKNLKLFCFIIFEVSRTRKIECSF